MAVDPQALYEEFATDPNTFGYKIGNGVSFEDKQNGINLVRDSIQIQRVSADKEPGPGEVQENVFIQMIRDCIDPDEYKLNCAPEAGDSEVTIGQKESLRARILTFYGGSDGQSLFAFTDLSKTQILDLFTNAQWPTTRANLVALQLRDGSRAEQLFGNPPAPVTRDDMKDAEAYATTNALPSLHT